MNPIFMLDILSFLFILISLALLLIFRKNIWEKNFFFLIGLFLICISIRDISNIANQSYYTGTEGLFNDFADMLDPFLWIFVIYALLQHASKRELEEEIEVRKKTEDALTKSREKLILTMQGASIVLWEWDLVRGNITFSDPENIEQYATNGHTHGHASPWADTVHPDDVCLIEEKLQGCISGELSSFEIIHRQRLNDQWRWVLCKGRTVEFDSKGKPIKAIGTHLDITDQKNLEDQLLQSQKMESIGQLAGGVAHDFNNLLLAILGYCELVIDRLDESNPIVDDVIEIKKAGNRAAMLTHQLLAFSRKQMLSPKLLNLNKLIINMDGMLRRLIGEDIHYVTITDHTLGLVKADPGQIEQVITNLVVNARDAMPDGGKLIVETKNVILDENYAQKHIEVPAGDYSMLSISDTGSGMDEMLINRIFEPFFSTKEKERGTGLGLSTVHGIIKQSNGHISVYSEVGHGTNFNVYLPRAIETTETQESKIEFAGPIGGSETVLVVEDEEIVRKMIQNTLNKFGYNTLIASYSGEAFELVDAHKDEIQLLITDVILPVMSGRKLADSLTKKIKDLKVLYISGYTDNAICHHGILDENVEFLQKPFSPNRLLKKMREILDAKASKN